MMCTLCIKCTTSALCTCHAGYFGHIGHKKRVQNRSDWCRDCGTTGLDWAIPIGKSMHASHACNCIMIRSVRSLYLSAVVCMQTQEDDDDREVEKNLRLCDLGTMHDRVCSLFWFITLSNTC